MDEVDLAGHRDSANILYLPPYLPNGVYFILTRRRGVEVSPTVHTPSQLLNLLDYQINSQGDVRTYIQKRVKMGMTYDPLPVEKIKIVYILGEVQEPVSCWKICDFSGEEQYTVQKVLNDWQQFLHEFIKESGKGTGQLNREGVKAP